MAGLPGLIDFHTHFFSGSPLERVGERTPASLAAGDAGTGDRAAPDLGLAEGQRLRWSETLADQGVSHAGSFADHEDEADALLAGAEASAGRLVPFCLADPTAKGAVDRAEERFARRGLRGLVLAPALHGYRIDEDRVAPLLDLADRMGAPVVVHAGLLPPRLADADHGRPYDPSLSSPLHLIPTAQRFPRATFVVPRFGGGFLRETLMAGEVCENVLVDSSGDQAWLRTQTTHFRLEDLFERALGVFGADRILFGTGSTLLPRGWRFDLFHLQREALGALEVGPADQALVFHDNARRVLGL
mgnify:CR=1 FL=1